MQQPVTTKRNKWILFAAAGVALFFGLLFLELAGDVREGDVDSFDAAIFAVVGDIRSPLLTNFFLVVTHLGSFWLILILTIGVIAGAYFAGQRRMAGMLAIAMAGVPILSVGLKNIYGRARPTTLEHLVVVGDLSFPSGHSIGSVTFFVTTALLVWAHLPRRRMRIFLICYSLFIGVLVAASRVYLGVHFPSDVAGGAMVGLSWSIIVLLLDVAVRKKVWTTWRLRHPRSPRVEARTARAEEAMRDPQTAPHLPP